MTTIWKYITVIYKQKHFIFKFQKKYDDLS